MQKNITKIDHHLLQKKFFLIFQEPYSEVNLRFFAVSSMSFKCIVPFHTPTVVSHHYLVPSTLVATFHLTYILMKPLPLFIAHITEIHREMLEVIVKVVHLNAHISPQFL